MYQGPKRLTINLGLGLLGVPKLQFLHILEIVIGYFLFFYFVVHIIIKLIKKMLTY